MLVRLNIGRKAGEIQDIEISAAKAMITDGRAIAVEYENGTETEGVAQLLESDSATVGAMLPHVAAPVQVPTKQGKKK